MIRKRNILQWLGLSLIWILTIGALSSPQLAEEPQLKIKTSRNFLIVSDISFSMAETDWKIDGKRVRRWDAVKNVMHDFIVKREDDRMGLIFFGSRANVQAHFTTDLKTVDQLLEEADVGMAGQLTHIGKAIVKGIDMFEQDTIKTKVMLVLTDGVDAGTEILPLDAADLAKNDSIKVYTIGIGDPKGRGSDLDERTLEEIADLTDASYFRAIDSDRLNEIYAELDALEPLAYEAAESQPVTVLYFYPLGAALGIAILMLIVQILFSGLRQLKHKFRDD